MHDFVSKIDDYTTADGRTLAVRVWQTHEPPRARVIFLHGILSHGGWYTRCCEYLASQGMEVHFLDRRGSGLNTEGRGDVDCYKTWLDDVEVYLQQLGKERPRILCGISWGGKLAVAIARHRPDLLQGVGLLCPGLFARQEPGPLRRTALACPLPARIESRRVKIPLNRPELFTNAPLWQEYIARDPLALREITLRFASADRQLTRYARQAAPFLHVPMLLTLGGRDRIVLNGRTQNFFSQIPSAQKTILEYHNAAHTLEFEPDPEPYFEDLAEWMGKQAKSPGSSV